MINVRNLLACAAFSLSSCCVFKEAKLPPSPENQDQLPENVMNALAASGMKPICDSEVAVSVSYGVQDNLNKQ